MPGGRSIPEAHSVANKRAENVVAAYPLFQEERGGAIPTSALQFTIVEIGMRLAQDLNRQWHSMLPRTDLGNLLCGTTSVAYAAEYQGNYFAVAIWSQPIIRSLCDGKTIELRRLAITATAPKYTASRMLGIMRRLVKRKWPHLIKAISYQAIDVHKGTIYQAAGWKVVGEIVAARPQRFSNVNKNTRATAPVQTNSRKQRWEIDL
jgi:hypothetical protein